MAWDDVKDSTLAKSWRKLYDKQLKVENNMYVFCDDPEDPDFEGFDEPDFEGFEEVNNIHEIVQSVPNHLAKALTRDDINEWLAEDKCLQGWPDLTDSQLIECGQPRQTPGSG
ncbi:hypothetical protein Pmani_038554 [Petrolisthes manimaculis]|uniref:Uncharacterized protein n=1 Tax=Petrolisthes manimaculis TaxID=1843537 RepID=A0AAE1NFG0_9EUCA|nr:hypothetical protein Pmani_038554 [Petrolisthes manimaculis]